MTPNVEFGEDDWGLDAVFRGAFAFVPSGGEGEWDGADTEGWDDVLDNAAFCRGRAGAGGVGCFLFFGEEFSGA